MILLRYLENAKYYVILYELGPNTITSVLSLCSIKKLLNIQDLMSARQALSEDTEVRSAGFMDK